VNITKIAIATMPTEHPTATAITVAILSPLSSLSSLLLSLPPLSLLLVSFMLLVPLTGAFADDNVVQLTSSGDGIDSGQDLLVPSLLKLVPL